MSVPRDDLPVEVEPVEAIDPSAVSEAARAIGDVVSDPEVMAQAAAEVRGLIARKRKRLDRLTDLIAEQQRVEAELSQLGALYEALGGVDE